MVAFLAMAAGGLTGGEPQAGGRAAVSGPVPPAILVDGSTRARIVIPEAGPETVAEEHLQTPFRTDQFLAEMVKEITGAELAVVSEKEAAGGGGPVVHIGRTRRVREVLGERLKTLDRDGYILLARPGELLVAGGSSFGTYFGVSELLHQYAGVRWYFPGKLGRFVPSSQRLVLENVNWVDEPVIKGRMLTAIVAARTDIPEEYRWMFRNRIHTRYPGHHAFNEILDPKRFGREHPEYYPMQDGQRKVPVDTAVNWQPCFSNPEVVRMVAETAVEYFKRTGQEAFSVMQNDGAGFCECPGCRAMNAGGDFYNQSPAAFTFWNRVAEQVAKQYPDRVLVCSAYFATFPPPKDLRLHPMLLVYIVAVDVDTPTKREGIQYTHIDNWARIASQTGYYDWMEDVYYLVPRIYTKQLTNLVRHGARHNLVAYKGEACPNWAFSGPKFYATARLLWNPSEDPDAITREFCENLFGPAAAPMARYFRRCEDAWLESGGIGTWQKPTQFLPFTAEVVAALSQDLDEARRLTAGDELRQRRVRFFRDAFEFTRIAAPSVESLRALRRGDPLRRVLQILADTQDPRPAVFGYWKEYAKNRVDPEWDLHEIQSRRMNEGEAAMLPVFGVGLPDGTIKTTVGRQIMTAAIPAAQPGPAREFAVRLRKEVDREMKKRLGTQDPIPPGGPVAQLVDEISLVASKAILAAKAKAPVIDGKLDDPCWKSAVRGREFRSHETIADTQNRTEIAVCHDEDSLYVAAWCPQPRAEVEAHKGSTGQDVPAWGDNCIELFFNRDVEKTAYGTEEPYHQLVINAAGGVFDMRGDDGTWTLSGLKCATAIGDQAWTLEAAIPLARLGMSVATDRKILFNASRNRQPERAQSSWFPTMGAYKDRPNRGLLILE